MRWSSLIVLLAVWSIGYAADYKGRVVDVNGQPIGYATVYPMADPVSGTATNNDGYFSFSTDVPPTSDVVVSFIGYAKQVLPLAMLAEPDIVITLHEQPIALQETVVAAKPSRQRNKRKKIAALLHQVYVRMAQDFPSDHARYRVVSDVRMDSEGEAWGMEQMVASITVLHEAAKNGRDSIQFQGEHCKRYLKAEKRSLADTMYSAGAFEKIDKNMRKAATAIDSGVVVHKALFRMGNVRYDFEQALGDLRHWSVSNESEGETVLTHVEKHNYFGIVKYSVTRHYIVDSYTYAIRRFSEQGEFAANIPFGMKLNKDQLMLLNLLNMSDTEITRFRLRKARAKITLNTIYRRAESGSVQNPENHLYIQEKNLHTDAFILGTRKMEIPVQVWATQRVVSLDTRDVRPLRRGEMTWRVRRQLVPIY